MIDKLIEQQTEYVVSLYREIEAELLWSIIREVQRKGYGSGTELKLQKLIQLSNEPLSRELIQRLNQITGIPLKEIHKVIEKLSVNVLPDLDLAYEQGLINIPVSEISLVNVLRRATESLNTEIGIVRTKAQEYTHREFRRIVDKTVLETQLGTMTADEAIVKSVRELTQKGVTVATYERQGKEVEMTLEPYVRRIIRTEFIKLANEINEEVGRVLEIDRFYVSQHLGARDKGEDYENHESWQGRVYDMNGLKETCGYGEMLGLGGINCRHRISLYIGEVMDFPPKIDTEENARVYELEQKQRRYESMIRTSKRVIKGLEELNTEDSVIQLGKEKRLLRARQARMRAFIADNKELRRNYRRERVVS